MPVKFLKLGFDKRVLPNEGFKNIYLNNNKVGTNIALRLNYYRGQHVSCIERLEVKIDGQIIPQYLILFCINGKKFSIDQLKDLYAEFWALRTTVNLEIYNGGIDEGEHDIELALEMRIPYMKFAPRTYGSLDSSVSKKMIISTN